MFLSVVPGPGPTLENLALVAGLFSAGALIFWLCERWYLDRQSKKHPGPKPSDDSPDHQRYYSRDINAAKDRFRQDTRTVVVYHESERSFGTNHVSHSYLMDVAEEIDIHQRVEHKLKATDSHLLNPPYPKTRYFELIIREYNEGPLSRVDDLQIYPVLVTTKSDTSSPGTSLPRDSILITERIYKETSTEEIQWIYSHDFHILAFVHAEDTLDQMVDRILGILDEIVIATKTGTIFCASAGDRQVLKAAFDAVVEQHHGTAVRPEIPPEQSVAQQRDKTRRPVILPGVQDEEIPEYGEGEVWITAPPMPGSAATRTPGEPKEIRRRPEFQPGVASQKIPEPAVIQPVAEQQVIQKISATRPGVPPVDRQQLPELQAVAEPEPVPARHVVQPRSPSKKNMTGVENKLEVASIRRLQKNILRDLNMFDLTPDSFSRSQKNIEHIQIPKKADVNKKLSEAEKELMDLNWLYE